MILLCGIPTESPMELVADALAQIGAQFVLFNQRRFMEMQLQFNVRDGAVSGQLTLGEQKVALQDVIGVYTRLMNEHSLPELQGLPDQAPDSSHCRRLHDGLRSWMEIAPCRVVNRSAPMATNSSKPYQLQLIRDFGFRIPNTLITNDPEEVRGFCARYRRVVYKSISGVRSIVNLVNSDDDHRLSLIRWCPVQFQEFVDGQNIRVHVVDTQVFATRVHSDAVDYRYAAQQGEDVTLEAVDLEDDLCEKCVQLAHSLKLPVAGIDLKVEPSGAVTCFEVNPSPGFSYFESQTGQQISSAIAKHLVGLQ